MATHTPQRLVATAVLLAGVAITGQLSGSQLVTPAASRVSGIASPYPTVPPRATLPAVTPRTVVAPATTPAAAPPPGTPTVHSSLPAPPPSPQPRRQPSPSALPTSSPTPPSCGPWPPAAAPGTYVNFPNATMGPGMADLGHPTWEPPGGAGPAISESEAMAIALAHPVPYGTSPVSGTLVATQPGPGVPYLTWIVDATPTSPVWIPNPVAHSSGPSGSMVQLGFVAIAVDAQPGSSTVGQVVWGLTGAPQIGCTS